MQVKRYFSLRYAIKAYNLVDMKQLENLIKARLNKGLTQAEIAGILKIHPSTYALYETGRNRPNFMMLIKLSNILDVSIDYIVGNENKQEYNELIELIERELENILELVKKRKK